MSNSSKLCTRCGICCTDLFSHYTADNGEVIQMPCTHSQNKICGIYSQRPKVCRSYRCKVLKAFEEKQLSEVEAVGLIEEALQHKEKLSACGNNKIEYNLALMGAVLFWKEHFEDKVLEPLQS